MSRELPSFDLVVATVERMEELGRFLDSIEAQKYDRARVILVDQNDDGRVEEIVARRSVEVERLTSTPGLSRARNVGLSKIEADVVAFPDDDCVYPPELLTHIAERFASDPELDGLTGRAADSEGGSATSWKTDRASLDDDNLWNRAISFTIFLRRSVIEQVGVFDEQLGLGSAEPWGSGEETDYLIRAVRSGARIEYDPTLVVQHVVREDDVRTGLRDGASVGYLLRKHSYPTRVVARMLVRPLGGAFVSLVGLDSSRARFRLATFRGRVRGYRGAKRAKTSA